jgi:fatty-acyl-CoA synthase
VRLFGCEGSYRVLVRIGLNAVVGMPDQRWGEAPHAFVVLKAGATATETELRNYARDHLAHFKCPQKIRFVPELPKGKVQKYVLRGKPAISKQ